MKTKFVNQLVDSGLDCDVATHRMIENNFSDFEKEIRQDQKKKCFKAMNSETVKCFSSVSLDYKEIEKAIMEAN